MPSKMALRSLISVEDLSASQAQKLIQLAQKFKSKKKRAMRRIAKSTIEAKKPKVVTLAFFEPSTRTSTSFEIAALRLGLRPVKFVADESTSLAKGESLHETLSTLMAMEPDLLVVRHSGDSKVEKLLTTSKVPCINAGSGIKEHLTQALLDAMTIIERRGKIEGEKILFVGDVEHSRVARSGHKLFSQLGAKVAL